MLVISAKAIACSALVLIALIIRVETTRRTKTPIFMMVSDFQSISGSLVAWTWICRKIWAACWSILKELLLVIKGTFLDWLAVKGVYWLNFNEILHQSHYPVRGLIPWLIALVLWHRTKSLWNKDFSPLKWTWLSNLEMCCRETLLQLGHRIWLPLSPKW